MMRDFLRGTKENSGSLEGESGRDRSLREDFKTKKR